MHELTIVRQLVDTADTWAEEHGIDQVKLIFVQVGAMTGVIPKYVFEYFPDVVEGTRLEGSELRIEEEEALVFCKKCGTNFDPEPTENHCPNCGSTNYETILGKSVLIKEIGY